MTDFQVKTNKLILRVKSVIIKYYWGDTIIDYIFVRKHENLILTSLKKIASFLIVTTVFSIELKKKKIY